MAAMTQGRVKPGGGWFVAAAILLVLGLVGVVLGVVLIVGSASTASLQSIGQAGSVTLDPGKDKTIYAQQPGTGSGSPCRATGPGNATFTAPVGSQTITLNGQSWYAVSNLHVDAAGSYNLQCDAGSYAIGDKGAVFSLVGGIFGGIAVIALGGLLGFVGLVVLVVTVIRRSINRKRVPPPYPYA